MAITQELVLLYIILGATVGIVYSLRRIYFLEQRIAVLEIKIEKVLERLTESRKKKK